MAKTNFQVLMAQSAPTASLNQRIAPTDRSSAIAAPAAQNQPAHQRNILPPSQHMIAVAAVGARLTMLSPSGQRLRHTLRKLPKARPRRPANAVARMRIMCELSIRGGDCYLSHSSRKIARLEWGTEFVALRQVRLVGMELPADSSTSKTPAAVAVTDPARAGELFAESARIMARLRAPGGCPWDREQSFDTIRKYTLEETYEVFDAIERRDFPHLAEELGDLLLQVLFYAEMAANEGHFTIADVLDHLNRKLVRRHPHVFGEEASRAAGNRGRWWMRRWKVRRRRCCATGKRSRLRRRRPQALRREQVEGRR